MLTNQHYDCEIILSEILSGINWYYALLREEKEEIIDQEFESVLYRLNEKYFYKAKEDVFEGEIIGVNEIGQLLIRKIDGKVLEFHFKEVEFLQVSQ
jgi:BirA family transcriptional regulator, biotin operon repressor / biotin---[acetyl-CoA-carboxylase] ligase